MASGAVGFGVRWGINSYPDVTGDAVVKTPFANSPEFRRLVDGETGVSLPRIALEMARDAYPSLDIDAYLARIDELSARVRLRCGLGARPKTMIGHVNWVLFVEEGFTGNQGEYYDPRNSYLNEVIDRRTGIPISLSILFAAVAGPIGLDVRGVNLPSHYLLRVVGVDPPLFVDPFHDGAMLDRAGCEARVAEALGRPVALADEILEPCAAKVTVSRMLRNLKDVFVRDFDLIAALRIARRQGILDPLDLDLQRDWGLLASQTGHPGEAIGPLARYTEGRPNSTDVAAVVEILLIARREVAASN